MVSIDRFVNVGVNLNTPTATRAGFGTVCEVAQMSTTTQSARTATYSSLAEVAALPSVPDHVLAAATAFFAQTPRPTSMMLGRRVPGTAQVAEVEITTAAAGTWSFALDGTTISYVAGADTEQEIAEGLADAILLAYPSGKFIVSDPVAGVFEITAREAGTAFVHGSFTAPGAGAGSITTTTANVAAEALATTLAALVAHNPDFYRVCGDWRNDADILAAAAWVAANNRRYTAQTSDPRMRDAQSGSIGAQINALGYSDTSVLWHADDAEAADVSWEARMGAVDLDNESATYAFKDLVGITPNTLTTAQLDAIEARFGNAFIVVDGARITTPGKAANDEWSDVEDTIDWTVARVKEGVFNTIAGAALKVPYTNAGVAMIRGAVERVGLQGVRAGHYRDDPAPTVTAPDVRDLDSATRQTRDLPNVVLNAEIAGAIHTTQITVNLQP